MSVVFVGVCSIALLSSGEVRAAGSTLAEALKKVEIPPDWFDDVEVKYDLKTPWKKARLDIRKMLAEGGPKAKQAVKLTYIFIVVNKVPPDDHEYPLNLFLGGEYAWATKVYMERLKSLPKGHSHEYRNLASLYVRFGEPEKAIEILTAGLERLPDPPWHIMNEAGLHDSLGDVYAKVGDTEKAAQEYRTAMKLFPTSKQPYGRHLMPRHVAKTQSKLDLMLRKALDLGKLRDGTYQGRSLGYGKELHATVMIRGGRIIDIRLRHQEKIEQGATKLIPKQIIEKQSLDVDAITGATVTTQAIVEATYRALLRAGLK